MFQIDQKSRKTICDQIIDNYKELIASGVLKKNQKIPSVREMAKILTVNPNTVQKAYKQLELDEYIYISVGKGTFVDDVSSHAVSVKDISLAKNTLREALNKVYYLNIQKEDAVNLFSQLIEERGDWK